LIDYVYCIESKKGAVNPLYALVRVLMRILS
jgi:hypothetical protein